MLLTIKKYLVINQHNQTALIITAICLCIILPSTYTVQKYTGVVGLSTFILLGIVSIITGYMYVLPAILKRLDNTSTTLIATSFFIALVIGFFIFYPYANAGNIGGGSDRDEALTLAATELIHMRYPYYPKTYLNQPITPLPGAVILSVPFVLLGNSAYQNIFWILVCFFVLWYWLGDNRLALISSLLISVTPISLQQLVTGGDLVTNCLYILLPLLLLIRIRPHNWAISIACAVILGLGLSSRLNFFLVFPLLLAMGFHTGGWKPLLLYFVIPTLTCATVTIPFFLFQPSGFSPLHTLSKLAQFDNTLPFASLIIPLLALFVTFFLSMKKFDVHGIALLRNISVIQAILVISSVVLSSIEYQLIDLSLLEYGIASLIFGIASSAKFISKTVPSHTSP